MFACVTLHYLGRAGGQLRDGVRVGEGGGRVDHVDQLPADAARWRLCALCRLGLEVVAEVDEGERVDAQVEVGVDAARGRHPVDQLHLQGDRGTEWLALHGDLHRLSSVRR